MRYYEKDFMAWAELKTALQASVPPPFFYEREIWWTAIGHNIGFEEDGKGKDYARPVLILRKFSRQLFWGIPLTTTERSGRYYVGFHYKSKQVSTAILSQLRIFDTKRLIRRDGVIGDVDFTRIQLGLMNIIKHEAQK